MTRIQDEICSASPMLYSNVAAVAVAVAAVVGDSVEEDKERCGGAAGACERRSPKWDWKWPRVAAEADCFASHGGQLRSPQP